MLWELPTRSADTAARYHIVQSRCFTMEHARKMVLIPRDSLERISQLQR